MFFPALGIFQCSVRTARRISDVGNRIVGCIHKDLVQTRNRRLRWNGSQYLRINHVVTPNRFGLSGPWRIGQHQKKAHIWILRLNGCNCGIRHKVKFSIITYKKICDTVLCDMPCHSIHQCRIYPFGRITVSHKAAGLCIGGYMQNRKVARRKFLPFCCIKVIAITR